MLAACAHCPINISVPCHWLLSAAEQALVHRADVLPLHIDGIEAGLTPEQWSGVRTFLRNNSVVFTTLELWWIGKTVARAQGSVVPPLDAEKEVYLNEVGDD